MASLLAHVAAFERVKAAVAAFDLGDVEDELVRAGRSRAWAGAAVGELRRFALLKKLEDDADEPCKLSPSGAVDEAWHALLLFTRLYRDFCAVLLGPDKALEHSPKTALDANRAQRYRSLFDQEPLAQFWDQPEPEPEPEAEPAAVPVVSKRDRARGLSCSKERPC